MTTRASSEPHGRGASASKRARLAGNESLQSSAVAGLGTTVRNARQLKAMTSYHEALKLSTTPDEAASAHKNLATVHRRMAGELEGNLGK